MNQHTDTQKHSHDNSFRVVSVERYIALFDILGFQAIVDSNQLNRVAEIFREFLLEVGKVNTFIRQLGERDKLRLKLFSDTILVYSKDVSMEAFGDMLKFCSLLVGISFRKGILLRGGLVKGETFINDDMFLGKPIVRAYRMEKEQDWVGCWIETPCLQSLDREHLDAIQDTYVLRYEIPLKSGIVNSRWALNWVVPIADIVEDFRELSDLRIHFNKLIKATDISWDVQRKILNTWMFIEHGYMRWQKKWPSES